MSESPITSVENRPGLVLIRVLPDSIDDEQVDGLRADVRAAAAAHPASPCVLDLSGVKFVPSLALAAFIRLHTELSARGQRLILAGLQRHVRDVFIKTRLDRTFELQDDVAAAARSIGVA